VILWRWHPAIVVATPVRQRHANFWIALRLHSLSFPNQIGYATHHDHELDAGCALFWQPTVGQKRPPTLLRWPPIPPEPRVTPRLVASTRVQRTALLQLPLPRSCNLILRDLLLADCGAKPNCPASAGVAVRRNAFRNRELRRAKLKQLASNLGRLTS